MSNQGVKQNPKQPTAPPDELLKAQSSWANAVLLEQHDAKQLGALVAPAKGAESYNRLMNGTVKSCLEGMYPYVFRVITDDQQNKEALKLWSKLCQNYRRQYPNTSHKLLYAVQSFPAFLKETTWIKQFPFLSDLAEYEWGESLLQNKHNAHVDESVTPFAINQNLETVSPVWNPLRYDIALDYDVPAVLQNYPFQNKGKSQEKQQPSFSADAYCKPTNLVIYRDVETHRIRYQQMNAVMVALIEALQENQSVWMGLAQLYANNPVFQSHAKEAVFEQAKAVLTQCQEKGLLLGVCSMERAV